MDDAERYIKNILIKLNLNINLIKKQIGLLLKQSGPLGQNEQVDHSVITLLKTSERLMKEFGDEVITIEVLLLSFTVINDQGKKILPNYHINFSKLQTEIKKLRKC